MLVGANRKPHDIVIYTDNSVTRDRSGEEGGGGGEARSSRVERLYRKTVEPT